jgi:anti-sigma B factor antagonist
MDFEIIKLENYTLINTLNFRLDTTIAPDLKSELVRLNASGEKNIILNISNCDYCDSSGLSAILVANRLCEDKQGMFILTGLQTDVEQIIRLSMLHTVLTITKTIEEAVDLLGEKENN